MGRTLNRVAGVVSAAALATFAATPAALAQDETSTSPTETTTSTSESSTSSSPTSTSSEAPTTTVPSSTSGIATSDAAQPEVKTTDKRIAPKAAPEIKGDTQEPPKDDDYQDNTGAGFVGLGGEGSLTINCAAGAPGSVATQYLDVTGGPDQDGADGRIWHYSVRVAQLPPGTTTGKFSWTCAGVEGNGVVQFEQVPPPVTSTTTSPTTTSTSSPTTTVTVPSSTAPVTTATSTSTSAASGNAAPKAQVKVAPKGAIETGFGGTAR